MIVHTKSPNMCPPPVPLLALQSYYGNRSTSSEYINSFQSNLSPNNRINLHEKQHDL